MASKAHVPDNSVHERRLRPIYDWLDTGNNKKALQECEKVLKKTPNLLCAKALRALSVLRMGRENESAILLDALVTEKPGDDPTLQAMTLCYRELQKYEKICEIYENAVKLDPTNEEFHTHLFMSYVRIGNFKLQQHSAMNLYKLRPKNPYYCWAVMSVIEQAIRGQGATDAVKRSVLLSLAERMIYKLIVENKLEAEQEVQLYLMVLELQNKFEEALEVYNGPLGSKLVCGTAENYKLPYLIKLKRWPEVNLLCKQILTNSVDHWNIWKDYINSVFHIMSIEPHINNHIENCNSSSVAEFELTVVDDTPEKAHEFICRIVENGADNGYLLRGPYLARFELCLKMVARDLDSNDLLGETIELFIEYFHEFGHKPCCVPDLKIYLDLLDEEKKFELSQRLIKDVGISSSSVPQTEQQMQRHLCSLQLSRLCGCNRNLSADHLYALVTAFSLHYQHGYETYSLNLLPTDQAPSDAYALLAAHILYDLAQSTKSSKPIVTALILVENLLKNSTCSFKAKLLCIRLYHTIGAALGAHRIYELLEVKHLQLDSLGYVHCARLPTTGLLSITANMLDTTLKFFTTNYKDSSDHLTFCYKFGSFIKLEDFMDFREKLYNSFHYTMVAVDRVILNIIQCSSTENLYTANILPKDNQIEWNFLRDNHDLSANVSWDPERIKGPPEESDDIKELFKQNVQFLKLRTFILLAMNDTVNIVKSTDADRQSSVEALQRILKDWEDLYNKFHCTKNAPVRQTLVYLPLPSRLHSHLNCPYWNILSHLFHLVIAIIEDDTINSKAILADVEITFEQMTNRVTDMVENQNISEDILWGRREALEMVVNIVEIICVSSVLVLVYQDIIKDRHIKKSKKKVEPNTKLIITEVSNILKKQIEKLDNCLESWKTLVHFDLSDRLALLNLSSDGQNSVFGDINNSHSSALKELQTLLKSKAKLLTG